MSWRFGLDFCIAPIHIYLKSSMSERGESENRDAQVLVKNDVDLPLG